MTIIPIYRKECTLNKTKQSNTITDPINVTSDANVLKTLNKNEKYILMKAI